MRLLLFLVFCSACAGLKAQQELIDGFHEKAGSHASLFVGKVEHGYPASTYANHPYWDDARFYNGEILPFKRKKAKEFLAVLIDRNGAGMTAKQICAILFPDDTDDTKNAAYLRQLVLDLKNTLKTIRAHPTSYG